MLKSSHLRHPFRAAAVVAALLATQWNVRRCASRGKRRFRNDVRYNLQSVNEGFAPRIVDGSDDKPILERICQAYLRAIEHQSVSAPEYEATSWWQGVRQASLAPARRALETRDTSSLRAMYQNFFRDPCGNGLIGLPLAKAFFGDRIKDCYRHFFLSDALHRIDYWKERTSDRFELRELAGPGIGNPFGVLIDGTLVTAGAEYQHYCAVRIKDIAPSRRASVVEIGGGFGGMAYYLLLGDPEFKYADFDVPESLALTTYYLLKCFPNLKFLLYGEEELTQESIARSNVILMPAFELSKVPAKSVDVAFSSHVISDLSQAAKIVYLNEVVRMTRESFLNIGNGEGSTSLDELISARSVSLSLTEKRTAEWNKHKVLRANELECLYRIGPIERR